MTQPSPSTLATKRYRAVTGHAVAYPLVMRTAQGCAIEDLEGRRYLDFASGYGVVNVGWQRRELLEVLSRQSQLLSCGVPWMVHEQGTLFAERLLDLTPPRLTKCVRATSGAEAVETAIRAFRARHPQGELLSFHYAYHGGTSGALALSDTQRFGLPSGLLQPNPSAAHPPYCFRCPWGADAGVCGLECVSQIERRLQAHPEIRGLIFEPILGSGGIIDPPAEYYEALADVCRRHDLTVIADEVLTGCGRTGTFLRCDELPIDPDIILFAKGLSSGYMPISAAVMTEDLCTGLERYDDVTPSFSWSPLACAVASANLDLIVQQGLARRSQQQGERLKHGLQQLFAEYLPDRLGEVRGRGLLLGVELVDPDRNREPAPALVKRLLLRCKNAGLIVTTSWDQHVVVLLPPLTISAAEVDEGLAILQTVLAQIAQRHGRRRARSRSRANSLRYP